MNSCRPVLQVIQGGAELNTLWFVYKHMLLPTDCDGRRAVTGRVAQFDTRTQGEDFSFPHVRHEPDLGRFI